MEKNALFHLKLFCNLNQVNRINLILWTINSEINCSIIMLSFSTFLKCSFITCNQITCSCPKSSPWDFYIKKNVHLPVRFSQTNISLHLCADSLLCSISKPKDQLKWYSPKNFRTLEGFGQLKRSEIDFVFIWPASDNCLVWLPFFKSKCHQ